MKRLLFAAATIIFLSACSTKNPKDVLSDFFDAAKQKDFSKAKELVTQDSKMFVSMAETRSGSNAGIWAMDKFDKSKMELGEPVVNGDSCTISTKIKEDSTVTTMNFPLRKESGEWKVDLKNMMSANMNLIENAIKDFKDQLGGFSTITDAKGLADSLNNKLKDAMSNPGNDLPSINEDSLGKAQESIMKKLMEQKNKPEQKQ